MFKCQCDNGVRSPWPLWEKSWIDSEQFKVVCIIGCIWNYSHIPTNLSRHITQQYSILIQTNICCNIFRPSDHCELTTINIFKLHVTGVSIFLIVIAHHPMLWSSRSQLSLSTSRLTRLPVETWYYGFMLAATQTGCIVSLYEESNFVGCNNIAQLCEAMSNNII